MELGAQNNTQLITTSASAEFIQPIAWALHKYTAKALPSLHTPASSGNDGKKGVVEQEMKLRCKPGDLALIIHDEVSCRENIGKLVKVAGPLGYNQRLKKQCWLIEPVKAEMWHYVTFTGKHYSRILTFAGEAEHPDAWLFPIDPNLWSQDEFGKENTLQSQHDFATEAA